MSSIDAVTQDTPACFSASKETHGHTITTLHLQQAIHLYTRTPMGTPMYPICINYELIWKR